MLVNITDSSAAAGRSCSDPSLLWGHVCTFAPELVSNKNSAFTHPSDGMDFFLRALCCNPACHMMVGGVRRC